MVAMATMFRVVTLHGVMARQKTVTIPASIKAGAIKSGYCANQGSRTARDIGQRPDLMVQVNGSTPYRRGSTGHRQPNLPARHRAGLHTRQFRD